MLVKYSGKDGGGAEKEGAGVDNREESGATLQASSSGHTPRASLGSPSELCVSMWLLLVQHRTGVPHGRSYIYCSPAMFIPSPHPNTQTLDQVSPGPGKEP